jgi:hypothetical protein
MTRLFLTRRKPKPNGYGDAEPDQPSRQVLGRRWPVHLLPAPFVVLSLGAYLRNFPVVSIPALKVQLGFKLVDAFRRCLALFDLSAFKRPAPQHSAVRQYQRPFHRTPL